MKKYVEEYRPFEEIRTKIYPWLIQDLTIPHVRNGKKISETDTPLIAFAGDLKIVFVIKCDEETYEVVKDNMLPDDMPIELLYHTACENLARDVEFVISNTMYGAFGILADGFHETSALCLKHIWNVCADKIGDDLIILAPARDTIVFAAASQEKVVEQMTHYAQQAYERNEDRISMQTLIFTKKERELLAYEDIQH